MKKSILSKITIVLNKPKHPENIGSAARCALNMGIDHLMVVNPLRIDEDRIKKLATHFAEPIVRTIQFFDSLKEALSDFTFIIGTTARKGNSGLRQLMITPREMAIELTNIAENNKIALVFGPEDRGLTNSELQYCHRLVTIPTSAKMTSINLSHAVMILCYEIYNTKIHPVRHFTPRLAASKEIEDMYHRLQDIFIKINFINPENPDYWMANIRRFFSRTKLFSKDVQIIRGICRQIELHGQGKTKQKS